MSEYNYTDLIKQGLKIEKRTQTIKIIIMSLAGIYGLWWSQKVLELLKEIISLLK